MELGQGTQDWDEVVKKSVHTFAFDDGKSTVDFALQMIKEKIFIEIPIEATSYHQCNMTMQQWMACYNMVGEPDDDLTNINIPKSEGTHEVEGSGISSDQFLKMLKSRK